jgi:hypothetical protein
VVVKNNSSLALQDRMPVLFTGENAGSSAQGPLLNHFFTYGLKFGLYKSYTGGVSLI